MQIKELGKTLEADQPQFAACRSLLRAGPAASLRMNIRAVAQYANEVGNDQKASNDVDQCLRALEELDSLLLHASRNEPGASVKSMKSNIGIAVNALNRFVFLNYETESIYDLLLYFKVDNNIYLKIKSNIILYMFIIGKLENNNPIFLKLADNNPKSVISQ
ncbi:hypothetical protein HanHA300_Chr10g0374961 [Helianthus annuus]|nr:hypothetical protein HanHA300_Chr10g0374961 [Helianthus annuus]